MANVTGTAGGFNNYLSEASGALQGLSNTLLTGQGIAFAVYAVLLLCILATVLYALRHISQSLRDMSDALDEQSRSIQSVRRSLKNVMELLASRQTAPKTPEREQAPFPNVATSVLRQEIESLRAEILAHVEPEPPSGDV